MPGRQKDFLKYREIHTKFIYKNYRYSILNESISISFEFLLKGNSQAGLSDIRFEPTIILPINSFSQREDLQVEVLENLIFNMGMVELISYWKAACPKEIIIEPFHLNENQILFWKKLYWNGLGEFFYVNEIETNMQDFMHIKSASEKELKATTFPSQEKVIIPIGGGKDSAVSLEILKDSSLEIYPFIINPRKASLNTVKQAGISVEKLLLAQRNIDSNLIKLNEVGYLNGHTPFSAMLAFTSLLQAYLTDTKYIALSNESSANEPSVADSHVNHQYSKTFEFESDFREYYKTYISSNIEYFSFLRPISELQIANLFSKFKNHHYSFRSCNVGSKTDSWCCDCPKCLFTYIMLAPFLPEKELNNMLGENLIIKPSLVHTLKELQGLTEVKPFECVGTVDEVNLALYQAIEIMKYPPASTAVIYSGGSTAVIYYGATVFANALKDWNEEHFLPDFLELLLKQKLSEC
ncbi:MAG: hypothetical protein PF484_00305 [Bacteroidales bacterium]|jgi:hypothetical protein|nr:hypothetical protein [Bacteroidales bacterium]